MNFINLIGNTPLIHLQKASQQTGCHILGKAEFLNPGGSVKDRAALAIIRNAEKQKTLKPGGLIVEGTAGNTGIGLALIGNTLGYPSLIVMPETQSQEKQDTLRLIGAQLKLVPAVPYSNPENYVHVSQRLASQLNQQHPNGAIWANQFDNLANKNGHYQTTGKEILSQTNGHIHAFTCATGTGGTLSGVSQALKEYNPDIQIVLADPMGSALYNWFTKGHLKAEGNSITEGIGQGRVTQNLANTLIDDYVQITDQEALPIIFSLIREEGLILGSSSGINIAAAIKVAQKLGPGHTIVTILCDHGLRYQSKLFNPTFLRSKNLPVPDWIPT